MRVSARGLLLAAVVSALVPLSSSVRTQSAPTTVLLVTDAGSPNPFGPYLAEILATEGVTGVATAALSSVSAGTLADARLVVLAEATLTAGQSAMFASYVSGGGRLVAMRPDPQLAGTLGLSPAGTSTTNGYIGITQSGSGAGLAAMTLPFRGEATHYGPLAGATAVATLYSTRDTATAYPAVLRFNRTATWTYDLARSVVFSRQGEPQYAGLDRDGFAPTMTNDPFFEVADPLRMEVPHADVQMRLLTRVIGDLLADDLPMPRLWYYPAAKRALMLVTADGHTSNPEAYDEMVSTVESLGGHLTFYLARWLGYPTTEKAAAWRAAGHEISLHPYVSQDSQTVTQGFTTAANHFAIHEWVPGTTTRIHNLEWQGWVEAAQIAGTFGVGLDLTAYSWGPAMQRPNGTQSHGYITGSGLPMRLVTQTGSLLPVHQQTTNLIDHQLSGIWEYADPWNPTQAMQVTQDLIDESISDYHTVLVTQFQTDYYLWGEVRPWADGTMTYAAAHDVPLWTAERWLRYTEARKATVVSPLAWDSGAGTLTFTVTVPNGAEAQTVMLPATYAGKSLTDVHLDGDPVGISVQTINDRPFGFVSIAPEAGGVVVVGTYGEGEPGGGSNTPPVALDDATTTTMGVPVVLPVLANDGDADNHPLQVTDVTTPNMGTVTVNPNQTLTYTPPASGCGTAIFSYTIADGYGGTDTANVSVSITGCPDPAMVLLVTSDASPNPFGAYLGEILRAEGIMAFTRADLSTVTADILDDARLVVLAEAALTSTQAGLFQAYVAAGGRLVAMRPDAQLNATLGVTDASASTDQGYLAIDTNTASGSGLTATTLPIHGSARHYQLLSGAQQVARLYSNRTTPTAAAGVITYGRTATWTFDLARSVAYARQGHPENAGTDNDGLAPIRTIDVFHGAIDKLRVDVPHADVHMRLFSRVIGELLSDVAPLPRLWYFPENKRTLMVLTSDTHTYSASATQALVSAVEARGGRLSIYVSRWVPSPDATTQDTWRANGHEIGFHPYGASDGQPLQNAYQTAASYFTSQGWTGSRTTRHHQVEWDGWATAAETAASFGIGMDTSFYTWGPAVTFTNGSQAHGFINGSGLPMKFVTETGAIVPVFQQSTSLIDEALVIGDFSEHLTIPQAVAVSQELIDDSQNGGYSALTTQFHADYFEWGEVGPWVEGTLDYALSQNVPMWTAERWLQFNEARAQTTIGGITWTPATRELSVQITVPANGEPQSLRLPMSHGGHALGALTIDGTPAPVSSATIHGDVTAFVTIAPGTGGATRTVVAQYGTGAPLDTTPPVISDVAAGGLTPTGASITWTTDEPASSQVEYGTTTAYGTLTPVSPSLTVEHSQNLSGLTPNTLYHVRVHGVDAASNAAVSPDITFTTPPEEEPGGGGTIVHTTLADFGVCEEPIAVQVTSLADGEVRLAGWFGDEYLSPALSSVRWAWGTWGGGSYTPTFQDGKLSLAGPNGALVRSASTHTVGVLDVVAELTGTAWQHIGWGALEFAGDQYLLFSTANTTNTIYARSNMGGGETRTVVGTVEPGFHHYRIVRTTESPSTDLITYYVDGVVKAEHSVPTVPALYVYQSHNGGGTTPALLVDRLWLSPPHAAGGTFQSCAMDAGSVQPWATAIWTASVPSGTALQVQTRTSVDGVTWSDWSSTVAASGNALSSPAGRYLQYLLTLSTSNGAVSPALESFSATYGTPD